MRFSSTQLFVQRVAWFLATHREPIKDLHGVMFKLSFHIVLNLSRGRQFMKHTKSTRKLMSRKIPSSQLCFLRNTLCRFIRRHSFHQKVCKGCLKNVVNCVRCLLCIFQRRLPMRACLKCKFPQQLGAVRAPAAFRRFKSCCTGL